MAPFHESFGALDGRADSGVSHRTERLGRIVLISVQHDAPKAIGSGLERQRRNGRVRPE